MQLLEWHLLFSSVIPPGRLRVSKEIIDTIRVLEGPTNTPELWSFLRLCNVFRHLCQNSALLTALTNKELVECRSQTFDGFADDETTALRTLKVELKKQPILGLPRSHGAYYMDTDSFEKQGRCVLLKIEPSRTGHTNRLLVLFSEWGEWA